MGSSSRELAVYRRVVFHVPDDQRKHFEWLTSQIEADLEKGMTEPPVIPQLTPPQIPRISRCQAIMTPIASAVKLAFHPITIIGYLSSFPAAFYAFLYPAGAQPEDVSIEWWNSLSFNSKTIMLILALGSFSGTMLGNHKYVPLALQRLRQNLSQCCRRAGSCFSNTLSFKLGLIAALILFGVSYGSLEWTNIIADIVISLANFFSTGARRYVGVVLLADLIQNIFSQNGRYQRILAGLLSRLEDEPKSKFAAEFANCEPNQENAQRFIFSVCAEARAAQSSGIGFFRQQTNCDLGLQYTKRFFTFATALAISTSVVPANSANGYQGINVFAQIFARTSLDFLSNDVKFLMGLTPSIVTAIFFFVSIMNIERAIDDIWESMRIDPKRTLPATLAILSMNASASIGFGAISNSTLINPRLNFFGIDPKSPWGITLNTGNTLGAALVGVENIGTPYTISKKVPKTGLTPLLKFIQRKPLDAQFLTELRQRYPDLNQLTSPIEHKPDVGLKV